MKVQFTLFSLNGWPWRSKCRTMPTPVGMVSLPITVLNSHYAFLRSFTRELAVDPLSMHLGGDRVGEYNAAATESGLDA